MARKKKAAGARTASAPTTSGSLKAYVGILDTLGLDSFAPLDHNNDTVACMQIRAMSNPQRHAKMFIAEFEPSMEPEKHIKKLKDPWDMWAYIQLTCTQLKCDPKDARTIKNMKKLAEQMVECTGSAHGV